VGPARPAGSLRVAVLAVAVPAAAADETAVYLSSAYSPIVVASSPDGYGRTADRPLHPPVEIEATIGEEPRVRSRTSPTASGRRHLSAGAPRRTRGDRTGCGSARDRLMGVTTAERHGR